MSGYSVRSRLYVVNLITLSLLLIGCATTGPGGKRSFIIVPVSQEIAIGTQMAAQVEKTEKLLDDPVWQNYINEIGQRIVKVCDRRDIDYHFAVIESNQINAFAAPGGFIYFYTGLLKEMHSEAELAAVVAHETSHVVARHGVKRLQTVMGVSAVYELVFGNDANKYRDMAVGIGLNLLFAKYSRNNEREADNFGIHYMVKAGYDPHGALEMFKRLAELGGTGYSNVFEGLLASHPETQERIANAKAQITAMQPLPGNLTVGREK